MVQELVFPSASSREALGLQPPSAVLGGKGPVVFVSQRICCHLLACSSSSRLGCTWPPSSDPPQRPLTHTNTLLSFNSIHLAFSLGAPAFSLVDSEAKVSRETAHLCHHLSDTKSAWDASLCGELPSLPGFAPRPAPGQGWVLWVQRSVGSLPRCSQPTDRDSLESK